MCVCVPISKLQAFSNFVGGRWSLPQPQVIFSFCFQKETYFFRTTIVLRIWRRGNARKSFSLFLSLNGAEWALLRGISFSRLNIVASGWREKVLLKLRKLKENKTIGIQLEKLNFVPMGNWKILQQVFPVGRLSETDQSVQLMVKIITSLFPHLLVIDSYQLTVHSLWFHFLAATATVIRFSKLNKNKVPGSRLPQRVG